jgi:DNA-binding beta-propeller fold protein YncE
VALIIHSALVESIHKKMHGSILRRSKHSTLASPGQQPRNPRSARQQQLRAHFNYLAGRWGTLNSTQKTLWETYASQLSRPMSGFNAFTGLNTRLLAANYSTLVVQDTPPATPSTPEHVSDFYATKITATTNVASWTAPAVWDQYVEVYASVEPGMSYKGKRRWSLLECVPGADVAVTHVHDVPEDIPIYYRAVVLDPQGRVSPPTHAETAPVGDLLYIADTGNSRIKELREPDLGFLRKFGTYGQGDNQFDGPEFIASDSTYLYISDTGNHRIKKHYRSNFALQGEFGEYGIGDSQFKYPEGITVDDAYIYVSDYTNNYVKKFDKETFTFIQKDADSGGPYDLDQDDTYLWTANYDNQVIQRHLKTNLTTYTEYDCKHNATWGSPVGICADDDYFWVTLPDDHQVWRFSRATGLWMESYGSQGSGDNQFQNPSGIKAHGDYLYICDAGNDRIKVHRKSDWAFVRMIGTQGSGNVQFNAPRGVCYHET